jgi:hypothetical protein
MTYLVLSRGQLRQPSEAGECSKVACLVELKSEVTWARARPQSGRINDTLFWGSKRSKTAMVGLVNVSRGPTYRLPYRSIEVGVGKVDDSVSPNDRRRNEQRQQANQDDCQNQVKILNRPASSTPVPPLEAVVPLTQMADYPIEAALM